MAAHLCYPLPCCQRLVVSALLPKGRGKIVPWQLSQAHVNNRLVHALEHRFESRHGETFFVRGGGRRERRRKKSPEMIKVSVTPDFFVSLVLLKGLQHENFEVWLFSSNNSSWSCWTYPRAILIFSEFSWSYSSYKTTPWCPGHRESQQK